MAFCAQCGAEAAGNFCPKCGATIGAAAGAPPPNPGYAPPPGQQGYAPVAQSQGMGENTASALCYLVGLVTGIIFLVIAPYNQNKTVRFHAFQSIFFHISVIVIYIGLGIVTFFLGIITHGFGFLGMFLYPILGLVVLGLWLYLMFSAYNNKTVVLPVIGNLARKQA